MAIFESIALKKRGYADISFRVNLANEPSTTVSAPLDSGTEYHIAVEFNSVVLIPFGLASGSPQ